MNIRKLIGSPLFWIATLAIILRVYKLGTYPVGFHVDEVKVGWNAYSILKTGQDDRGNTLALYYNSFGDYRPTGIFYATIPSILIFGKSEFAVRLPSALLGALTVLPLFYLVMLISKNKGVAYVSALLLALSPWHIGVSRATSEVVISMFIALTGYYYFLKGFSTKNKKEVYIGALVLALSYFFYHSIRLIAPLFILGTIAWKVLIEKNKLFKPALITLVALSLLTLTLSLNKEARARFSQVSIFNDLDVAYELSRMPFEEGPGKVLIARIFHNKPVTYTRRFINEYAKYFSSDFYLDSTKASPGRYQTVGVGLTTYVEFLLLILGLVAIAQKKASALPLLLLLLAPIPGALTTEDSPNLHRSLLMLPFLITIMSYGFFFLKENYRKLLLGLLTLNFIFFAHMYLVHNRVHNPLYRNVGAKELAVTLNELRGDYEKIILTNIPDDPYPWIAFFNEVDPGTFNKDAVLREKGTWTSGNFVFTGQRCPSRDAYEAATAPTLVVDADACAKESKLNDRSDVVILTTIKRTDETEVYTLWTNKLN